MYFRIPFASSGTTTAIPETQPGNGAINWTTGYSNVYSLEYPTDPLALLVERAQHNYLWNQVTTTLKNIYENGIPPFIESADNGGSPYSYSKDSLVKRSGIVYSSNVNSNTTAPPGASWTVVDMAVFNAKAPTASPTFTGVPVAPTAAAATANTQLATTAFVRNAVALFGVGSGIAQRATNLNLITDGGLYYYLAADSNLPYVGNGSILHAPYTDTSAAYQIACDLGTQQIFFRTKASNTWNAWRRLPNSAQDQTIISYGGNSNGYWRVFSNGNVIINRTVSQPGTTSTYVYPISIASAAGATISMAPLVGSYPAPGPYGAAITTGSYTIYGPTATLGVEIFFPFGA